MLSRRQMITGAVGVAAGSVAAGCTSGAGANPSARWGDPGSSLAPGGTPSTSPVRVAFTPAGDATNVSPTDKVVISATGGTIRSCTVSAGGKTVEGTLETDQRTWRSTGDLAYGQTYTVTASVADPSGATSDKTCTFSTVKPGSTTSVAFQANSMQSLKTGGTYGIGQVVIVHFSRPVTDKAAAQKAVVVDASPSVDGKFFWLDNPTLHYRPEKYWAAGTKISVKVNLLGVNLGGGVWGSGNASTNYNIGDSRIAVVDTRT